MTEMTPREALTYLFDFDRFTVKPGFDRAERLLEAVDRPHEEFEAVQVGGTNGKGSVARVVESGLRSAGHSVGLYTSPHMLDVGERVRVDGEKTRKTAMRDFVEEIRPAVEALQREGDPPTFFEVTTVMALYEFSRRDVDYGVLEVGLGGRFDTTSVCSPRVSAVTNVALEHTETLGDTVEEIARDVAHVVPFDGVCVTGAEGTALDILGEKSRERGSRLVEISGDSYSVVDRKPTRQNVHVEVGGDVVELTSPLVGDHQARNVAVAVAALDELGVSADDLREGVRRATWPARFEVVDEDPAVVLDAAHNPAGCAAAAETYRDVYGEDAAVVFGAMADKDVEAMAEEITGVSGSVHVASPAKDRAAPVGRLESAFEREGVDAETHVSVSRALAAALSSGRHVLVTGSLFTVGEARRRWSFDAVSASYLREPEAEDALSRYPGSDATEAVFRTHRHRNLTDDEASELEDSAEASGASMAYSDDGDYVDAAVSGSLAAHRRITGDADLPTTSVNPSDGSTDVMAVVNVTPDSFYDGGRYDSTEAADERVRQVVDEGADVVDVGGESTRPGAEPVPVDEEIERVLPVVEALVDRDVDAEISVDTRNPETARAVLDTGADWINDVTGLDDPEMRDVVADHGCRVVVMDSVDVPVEPSGGAEYDDVVDDVLDRLSEKVLLARRAGVDEEDVVLDPGIGFGKGSDGDWELLRRTDELASVGYPVLIGCSRKSFLTDAVDVPEDERLEPTLAANLVAASKGASVLRVHDVEETVKALRTLEHLEGR